MGCTSTLMIMAKSPLVEKPTSTGMKPFRSILHVMKWLKLLETGERINYTPEMMEWVFGVMEAGNEAVTEINATATP